jgi:hypothetical protein
MFNRECDPATVVWRDVLHGRLATNAVPVVVFPDSVRSAASVWAGLRAWVDAFREAGIGRGDLVVAQLSAGEALLQLLLACLWEGVSLDVVPYRHEEPRGAAGEMPALVVCGDIADDRRSVAWRHCPAAGGWPNLQTPLVRRDGTHRDPAGLATVRDGHGNGCRTHGELHAFIATHALYATLQRQVVLSAVRWDDLTMLGSGVLLPLLVADELFVVGHGDVRWHEQARAFLDAEPVTALVVGNETPAGGLLRDGLTVYPLESAVGRVQ